MAAFPCSKVPSLGARDQPRCCAPKTRTSSESHACTHLSVRTWQLRRPFLNGRISTILAAKRGDDEPEWDDRNDRQRRSGGRSRGGGFQFSNRRGIYRVQYNDYEAEVRQDEAWKLLVPLVGGLVLSAAVIGPLIIGLAFTAVAVGAALSAGALFTSLFLPFFVLIGMGALFFGGLTFSAFATLGTALLLPKLIALAVVAGGVGLGAMAASLFLKSPSARKVKVSERRGGEARTDGRTIDVVPEPETEADPEVERQLREFDELLAGREEQRQRTEQWKSGGGGGGGGGSSSRRRF